MVLHQSAMQPRRDQRRFCSTSLTHSFFLSDVTICPLLRLRNAQSSPRLQAVLNGDHGAVANGARMTADQSAAVAHMPRSEPVRAELEPDPELAHIERARSDPTAFAPLYEAYADLVWRFAMSRLGDPERAADATSQTFVKAIAALPNFHPERRPGGTTFRSWLMTIARNVVIDEARTAGLLTDFDEPSAQPWLIDNTLSPETAAIAAVERQRIDRALAQLPDTQRKIIELRAIGMKGVEIARLLNMSLSAVKTANHRAYARLRDLLSERDDHQEMTP